MIRRLTASVAILILLVGGVGCRRGPLNLNPRSSASPITQAEISYVELAGRYNQTVRYFDQLWVRNAIKIEWNQTLKNGDRRSRNLVGDGKFIFVPPRDSVLTVEHLGTVYLWAGSNDEQYWLFDLSEDEKAAYLGRFDALGRPGTRTMPIPVRPDSVAYLLGVLPLPVNPDASEQPVVEEFEGQYFIEPPGLNLRMLIDKQTYRPTRVYLTDRHGYSQIRSDLSGQTRVVVDGLNGKDQPVLCETAVIYVTGYETRLTLNLEYATTDASRINERVFDFETLRKLHKPSVFINLDGAE